MKKIGQLSVIEVQIGAKESSIKYVTLQMLDGIVR
jgi:hypothetical protein